METESRTVVARGREMLDGYGVVQDEVLGIGYTQCNYREHC